MKVASSHDARVRAPGEKLGPSQQQPPKSICSDLSSLLDDLSFMNSTSSGDNSSGRLKHQHSSFALVVSPEQNQSNMDLPRGHNEYYPLEDSFSDLIGSGRDVFAGDAFPPFPETQTDAGGYPLSGIHYPGPNDVMFGRYVCSCPMRNSYTRVQSIHLVFSMY